jgi:putative transposase
MSHAFRTLLWMLLQYFAPRHNAQIRFLKAQIEILRRRIPGDRIIPSPDEKAELLRIGAEFGQEVKPVLEIVKPKTYRQWVNDAKGGKKPKKSGRPRLSPELRDLVVRMGKENLLWGYRRIVGEMKKLGYAVGHASVRRILIEADVYPTPEKKRQRQPPMPWSQFIASHMESLVACDFFTKPVRTLRGKVEAYVLVFIHLGSRKVYCTPATFHPDEEWVMRQAQDAAAWMQNEGIWPMMLLMDRDTKFTKQFRRFWKKRKVRPKRVARGAPDANTYCESFLSRLKGECLNHFVLFSLSQMDYIVQTWVDHYLHERPHRGLGNNVIAPSCRLEMKGAVCCRERLGGLLKSYYRTAA